MRIAVYAGTFDPVTNGHLDVIHRSVRLFDKVIVAVARDNYKNTLFTLEERVDLIRAVLDGDDHVEIELFQGLLIDYCKKKKASTIIRGLRVVSDFEYEMQMALMNKKLHPDIETTFLMTDQKYSFLSSKIIKQVAQFGGCVKGLVPEEVSLALAKKFGIRQQD
ncbi:pantetheine-phosphate adenylyltransferase [Dehalobacterium formicoaceticum]|uniref:Phosphopantetheine adenylyltransferase n=1 Tax=Dehalobacterium formicoaceticum TaxID=51515 RepID=A0ABT1Y5C4_9FIRM|nr:pantetheine-phosphate adenylyltransferase [Dehalobacterium formicoaceticum]MCR6546079.1 pantetheine-phosphate adenylyltransferase [Dehalobacterium formicoaceticum]